MFSIFGPSTQSTKTPTKTDDVSISNDHLFIHSSSFKPLSKSEH